MPPNRARVDYYITMLEPWKDLFLHHGRRCPAGDLHDSTTSLSSSCVRCAASCCSLISNFRICGSPLHRFVSIDLVPSSATGRAILQGAARRRASFVISPLPSPPSPMTCLVACPYVLCTGKATPSTYARCGDCDGRRHEGARPRRRPLGLRTMASGQPSPGQASRLQADIRL